MDLDRVIGNVIRDLQDELNRIDRAITVLEEITTGRPVRSRRGRKYMPPEERALVSERMKRYWEQRRMQKEKRERRAREATA